MPPPVVWKTMTGFKLDREQEIFERYPVPKAVAVMVIPTVISQVIHVLYNLADTWFVGLTGDPNAVAAVSVCMPLYLTMTGLSNLFGVGGAGVIGRALGSGDAGRAKAAFSTSLWGSAAIAAGYSAAIFTVHETLLRMIGGDDGNMGYAVSYTLIAIVAGSIPTVLAAVLGNLIRATGNSRIASFGMAAGAMLNIALDPLLMFVVFPPGYEVAGAAVATMLANLFSLVYFLAYIAGNRQNSLFCVRPYPLREAKPLLIDEVRCGIPSFLLIVMAMFSNCVLNPMVASTGNQAMAGLGITRKVDGLAHSVNQGVTQGMLPLAAYCWSSGNWKRMRRVISLSAAITEGFSLVSTLLCWLFAPQIIGFFIADAGTIQAGAAFLRILSLAVPVYSLTFVVIAVFQAMSKTAEPFLLSVIHKGSVDLVIMVWIFRKWGGSYAPWGNVASELIALAAAVLLWRRSSLSSRKGAGTGPAEEET